MSSSEEDFLKSPDIIESVLKVCCGNPLAIVVAAGLLAAKAKGTGQPRVFENNVLSMMNQDHGSQVVTKMLDMSYSDLPLHLNDINDEIGCTIHNIIHELIRSLSTEENFVTVGEHLSSRSYPSYTIRRFTHDCSRQYGSSVLASMMVHLSKVRSLAVSGNTNNQLSDASNFKLVRVLNLEGATGLRKRQLRNIRNITVDLRQTKVNDLPQLATANLVSLLGDCLMIPRGMDDMLRLEELSMIVVSHGYSVVNAAEIIGKSKLLRVLGVKFESCDDQMGLIPFFDAVMNSNLLKFVVDDYYGAFLGLPEDCWYQYSWHLDTFELNLHYLTPEVPKGILYLHGLTHLHIRVRVIEAEGLHVLEQLCNLVLLDLDSHDTLGRCIISKKGCFRSLKVFWLRCLDSGMALQFGPGVMPQLRRFKLVFGAKQTEDKFGDFDFGIENLICLEEVSVIINCSTHASEAAIRDQVSKIPNNPLLELRSVLTE
ncbi:unnamed protein product [Urochloa decumbens]|uniref:Disease resistance R13L4/SHOC-2-like LRR domain-containing protein n=1 Tax=Urochloa decumbens TaxID=240449 RepID=A0ABC9CWS5_9POAL